MSEEFWVGVAGVASTLFAILLVLALIVGGFYALMGLGQARAPSNYTGYVVDVVDDKGLVTRPSWVNVKTHPRSSTHEKFCIKTEDKDELLPQAREALQQGYRVTVSYRRPIWVNPLECHNRHAIITDIKKVNQTND